MKALFAQKTILHTDDVLAPTAERPRRNSKGFKFKASVSECRLAVMLWQMALYSFSKGLKLQDRSIILRTIYKKKEVMKYVIR